MTLHVELRVSLYRFFRGCLGKKSYKTMWLAEEKARECEAARPVLLHAYGCNFCGGWHLAKVKVEATALCGECLLPMPTESPHQWRCQSCADRIPSAA